MIKKLLDKPFSKLSSEEKRKFLENGQPRLNLTNLKSTYKKNGQIMNRNFSVQYYDSFKWLCGSMELNKLFCWPCIIFNKQTDKNVWSNTGYDDMNHLVCACKKHDQSESHINNMMSLKIFGRVKIDELLNSQLKISRENYNATVTKNREGLKLLIKITCFLASHDLPFRGHDESSTSCNRGNFKDIADLLAGNNPVLSDFIHGNHVFTGMI